MEQIPNDISRRQDWEKLILAIKGHLPSWKSNLLFLGSRLILVNSILSAIPTYWMSIFKLSRWVIKTID